MFSRRKTIFRGFAAVLCALLLTGPALAAEVDSGQVYCFSRGDFASEGNSLTGVCITGLPGAEVGEVMLGSRVIRSGDVLTASQLEQMTFSPVLSRDHTSVNVSYLPIFSDHVAPEATMVISIHGKEDKAPVAEDSSLETYKNLPNQGTLRVSDPEGQKLTFTLVRQPKRGTVTFSEDGTFLYTPKNNKVGTDSFTYTATDPGGNTSREATVTVKILKPTDSRQYTDTAGLPCQFAAEWMRNTGIFAGESVSGQSCFGPEEPVSRGQFLTMLMEVLELPVERSAETSGFLDEAPAWMKPYLAAALRSGIVSGYPVDGGVEFRPDQAITAAEAQAMLENALGFAVPTAAADGAAPEFSLALPAGSETMTRADAAQVLYQVSKLSDGASISFLNIQ